MLGLTGYYQKFIPAYADLVQPLIKFTQKTIPLYGKINVERLLRCSHEEPCFGLSRSKITIYII